MTKKQDTSIILPSRVNVSEDNTRAISNTCNTHNTGIMFNKIILQYIPDTCSGLL